MRYRIKALHPGMGVTATTVEALDEAEATARLQREGAQVLSIVAERGRWLAGRGARFPLLLFTQELIALLEAGLTLTEALETLGEKESRTESRQLIERLLATMREGRPFSAALAMQGEAFPPLYAATVRAAESTGDLSPALARYVGYQNQIDAVKKKVLSASIYPLLLIGVGTLVIGFLLGYVVPRFASVYADAGRDLPWMSKMLLAWAKQSRRTASGYCWARRQGLPVSCWHWRSPSHVLPSPAWPGAFRRSANTCAPSNWRASTAASACC